MPRIVFILSSLNDIHFRKRVEEFIKHGYDVEVYGFVRQEHGTPILPFQYTVLGTTRGMHYFSRIYLYIKCMISLAKKGKDTVFFYSGLDIALFARMFIRANYIYEVCDLTELGIKNKLLRQILVAINKNCIRNSLTTILTSEGFAKFFSDIPANKYEIIPNKVSPDCPPKKATKRDTDSIIRIGFVGSIRYETIYRFIKACCNRDKIEVHLYGIYSEGDEWSSQIKALVADSKNIFYHGRFSNPQDLPDIYSRLDVLLCTYTPSSQNVIYAEPNKLYEAMYFNCPIIVSSGTFLAEKVNRLNIGFAIDAMHEEEINTFIDSLTPQMIEAKRKNCQSIPDSECIDNYDTFFDAISMKIKK